MAVLENDEDGPTAVGIVLVVGTMNQFFEDVKRRAADEKDLVKTDKYHPIHASVVAGQESTDAQRRDAYGRDWDAYKDARLYGHTAIITRILGRVHEVWGVGPVNMDRIPGPGTFSRNEGMIKDPRAISFEIGLPSRGKPNDPRALEDAARSEEMVRKVCVVAAETKATYDFQNIDMEKNVGNCIAVALHVIKSVFAEWPLGIASKFADVERDVKREMSDMRNFNQQALAYRIMMGKGQFFK